MSEMICMVCGMKINRNNYMFNQHSFIEKNSESNITCCPFCGVAVSYLSENGSVCTIEQVNEETRKILDSAMKLEVFNSEFYQEASKLAQSEEVKRMFKDLSSIELFHAKVHMRLGGFKELPKLHKPDYSKHDSDELLIREASKREKHAVHFYNRYIGKIESKTIKAILEALAQVERQHIEILK